MLRRPAARVLLLAALGASGPAVSSAELPGAERIRSSDAIQEYSLVRRVRMPVVVSEERAGACAGLTADAIEVVEDGVAVRAAHLDPQRIGTLHALLLDTSQSMIEPLQDAKRALRGYLDSLPAHEPSLLATFDDSLILQASLGTDRARQKERLLLTEVGRGTTLWDSLQQLLRYVGSRPERKVLIVVTDGCDTQRSEATVPAGVIDLAARTDYLAVFPIGFKLPASCPGTGEDPVALLRLLARRTGGVFHALRDAAEFAAVVPAIRKRLDREAFVLYEPIPFGAGPRDRAGEATSRWREVELRVRGRMPGCTVELAGPPLRWESASRTWYTRATDRAIAPLTEPLTYVAAESRFRARVRDVVKDRGLLVDSGGEIAFFAGSRSPSPSESSDLSGSGPIDLNKVRIAEARGLKFTESSRSETAARPVELLVPPAGMVLRPEAHRVRPFLLALAAASGAAGDLGLPRSSGEGKRWSEVPFLVNGRTLLDLRPRLAEALALVPEYRDFARDRVRAERLAAVEELARTGQGLDPGDLDAVRELLRGDDWDPEPGENERYLGAWLGDVHAVELYAAAETWLAHRLLQRARLEDPRGLDEAATEGETLWEAVATWLPLPADTRLLGLLVPGYDPALEVIGFFRVVLPRPDTLLGGWKFSEEAPMGLRLVRWLLAQEATGPLLRGELEVRDVRYADDTRVDLGQVLERAGRKDAALAGRIPVVRRVTVVLVAHDPTARPLSVGAYLPAGPRPDGWPAEKPACLVVPAAGPAGGVERRFYGALAAAAAGSGVECVLPERPAAR